MQSNEAGLVLDITKNGIQLYPLSFPELSKEEERKLIDAAGEELKKELNKIRRNK